MSEFKQGMYKVHCEWLDALPDTKDVFWKVWADSPENARRKVFNMTRGHFMYYAITEHVEFLPDEPYVDYNWRDELLND